MNVDLEKLTSKQKDEFYKNLVIEALNTSYLRVPKKEYFFGEDNALLRKPSFLRRLYYTFF